MVDFDKIEEPEEPSSPEEKAKRAKRFLVAEGKHVARITEVNEETSSNGNPMLVFDFQIVGGKDEGKNVRQWQVITAKSLPIFQRNIAALDYPETAGKVEIVPDWFLGKILSITIEHEEWNGVPKNRVMNWEPAPASAKRDDDIPF